MELNREYQSRRPVRYIRVAETIYVANPNRDTVSHRDLAELHNITSDITTMLSTDPKRVDAGYISFNLGKVTLSEYSYYYRLPLALYAEQARAESVQIAQQIFGEDILVNSSLPAILTYE